MFLCTNAMTPRGGRNSFELVLPNLKAWLLHQQAEPNLTITNNVQVDLQPLGPKLISQARHPEKGMW